MTSTEPDSAASPAAGGVRPTRQRRAIASVMEAYDDFRSAQEIHALLTGRGEQVGLSTVYRALQTMAEGGEIDSLRTESGESIYRRCSATHHHHLVCRSCGATVEVEGPDGPGCGHRAVEHGDHVDYVHGGHRHAPHGGHYDEH